MRTSNVCLCEPRLRSFTNYKLTCIVLAGTSFATTGTLVPQRSTEFSRLHKGGGVYLLLVVFLTPSPFGYSILQKRESFLVAIASSSPSWLRGGGCKAGGVRLFITCSVSNSLPLWGFTSSALLWEYKYSVVAKFVPASTIQTCL